MTKLIFCFDGTCNDPGDAGDFFADGSISNVLKLHALFGGNLQNKPNQNLRGQHSFYYSGIGTRGNWLKQKLNALFAPPSGDMEDIIEQAKTDLNKFEKGDTVYVFGFSRGAAIARMFAAKICEHNEKVESVKFLGVFDTVAATKGSLDLQKGTFPASGIVFENGTLGEHVESAVHLVSIDEKRVAFQPTLFNHRKNVKEVWFAGVHSDIGGGYWFDGLSDITLRFMCEEAKRAGLTLLNPQKINFQGLREKNESKEDAICRDDIEIHPLHRGVMHEQQRASLVAKTTLAPRFVRVNVNDKPSAKLPIIHHTVYDRFNEVTGYRPYALRNRRFRILDKNGNIERIQRLGIAGLRKADDSDL